MDTQHREPQTTPVEAEPAPAPAVTTTQSHEQPSFAKFAIELAPLLLFFAAYLKYGIKPATGVLMVATLASLVAARVKFGRVTPMLMVTTVIVLLFGTLTFVYDDPSFIKMKPTAVYGLFAAVLGVGLAINRPFLRTVLGQAFDLTDEGWRKLTLRWIGFFLAMAGLNEVVWRTMSEQTWINFKVFAILPLTAVFMLAQVGLLKRYGQERT